MVVRTKCVIVSQGVVTPQLPVYVCRSGNSHQETLIQSYCRERERESERDRGKKLEKFTLDLGKVARVMSRSTHQRRTLFEEKGETNAELSMRRLCGRGAIWVCMSPYTQHLG